MRRVVVPRSAHQAGALSERLRSAGFDPVEIPVIAVEEPEDGGAALRAALTQVETYDWLIVTSTNAAARVAGRRAQRVAAIGPGTADVLREAGLAVDLVPERNVAEGLLAEIPDGPGRVLLPQADRARPVLAEGLRAKGWVVDAVVAYRTVPVAPPAAVVAEAKGADAIAFTSASTVTSFVEAAGIEAVPATVVCIGPITADAAVAAGLHVSDVADPHTLDGLVAAVVRSVHP